MAMQSISKIQLYSQIPNVTHVKRAGNTKKFFDASHQVPAYYALDEIIIHVYGQLKERFLNFRCVVCELCRIAL